MNSSAGLRAREAAIYHKFNNFPPMHDPAFESSQRGLVRHPAAAGSLLCFARKHAGASSASYAVIIAWNCFEIFTSSLGASGSCSPIKVALPLFQASPSLCYLDSGSSTSPSALHHLCRSTDQAFRPKRGAVVLRVIGLLRVCWRPHYSGCCIHSGTLEAGSRYVSKAATKSNFNGRDGVFLRKAALDLA